MSKTLCLLTYDIPQQADIPNPSSVLYRRGIRFNLSCWIIYQDQVPWNTLDGLSNAGATWGLFEFSPTANEALLKTAAASLKREIEEAKKRLNASLDKLDAKQPATQKDADRRDRERKNAHKRLDKLIADLTEACKVYGIDQNTLPFADARTYSRELQKVGGVRARLAASMTAAAPASLQAAAAADAIPLGILADALEDTGDQAATSLAQAARQAFAVDDSPALPARVTTNIAGNGTATATRPTVRNNSRPGDEYTVRGQDGSIRRVTSTMTHREAAQVCSSINGRFARDLASRFLRGRRLSRTQLAWLQVLAVEATRDAAPQQAATVPTPAAKPTPAPAADQHTMPAPAPSDAADDTVPGEQPVGTLTIAVTDLAYDKATKTLTGDASTVAPAGLPKTITVRKSNGNEATFTRTHEEYEGDTEDEAGELTATVYGHQASGLTLRILND